MANPSMRRHSDAGAVLITVLLVMLALLGLGVLALWMTSGNLQISANANLRNQALYVAEAGIEAIRNDLNANPARPMTALLAGGKDAVNDNVPTGVDASGQPNGIGAVYWFLDNSTTTNVAFPPNSFSRGVGGSGVQSTTMGTYTVWIRNDTGELRQGKITQDDNGTVVVRSRGIAPDGRTQVVLEVTMGAGATPGCKSCPPGSANPPVLCNSGKNACDENSSTQAGIVAQ
jgi:Tfp pilus assembly protein PilX